MPLHHLLTRAAKRAARDSCEGENTFFLLVTRSQALVCAQGKLCHCVAPKRCPPWSCSPAQPTAEAAVCLRPSNLPITSCLLPTGCSWVPCFHLHPFSLVEPKRGVPTRDVSRWARGLLAAWELWHSRSPSVKALWETAGKRSWVILMFLLLIKLITDVLVEITPVDLSGRLVGVQMLRTASRGRVLFSFCCSERRCIQRLPLNVQC